MTSGDTRDKVGVVIESGQQFIKLDQETPREAVIRMAGGFAMTQVLHTAVLGGIPDFMADRSCSVGEMATALGFKAGALERFLRMMVVLDLLVQVGAKSFQLSPTGQLLRSDHPQSMRGRIVYIGAVNYPVAAAAVHSLSTGETAFEHVFGVPFFEHLADNSDLGTAFNGLMQQSIEARVGSLLEVSDFTKIRSMVDIGGGNGALLAAILEVAENCTGIIFDQPAVLAEARSKFRGCPTEERVKFVEGDLFAGPYPVGADRYVLSNIIHDWEDDEAETILQNCCQAMRNDSELFLIEETLPELVIESPSTIANDYSMLLLTGGKERTEVQYRDLLNRSGLTLSKVTPFAAHNNNRPQKGRWAIMHCHAK